MCCPYLPLYCQPKTWMKSLFIEIELLREPLNTESGDVIFYLFPRIRQKIWMKCFFIWIVHALTKLIKGTKQKLHILPFNLLPKIIIRSWFRPQKDHSSPPKKELSQFDREQTQKWAIKAGVKHFWLIFRPAVRRPPKTIKCKISQTQWPWIAWGTRGQVLGSTACSTCLKKNKIHPKNGL